MFVESKLLFQSPSIFIGRFRCRPHSELWHTENQTGNWPIVVFPRTAVAIHQADRAEVVATPNQVMLYNAHHPYQRHLIDPRGDACEFYGVAPRLLADVSESLGYPTPNPFSPFKVSQAPCSSESYLSQRALFSLVESRNYDPLFVEETFLGILGKLMHQKNIFFENTRLRQKNEVHKHREQVESAKAYIARNYTRSLKLDAIAAATGCSVFHLCRIFRRHTGQSIHAFLLQLRLRSSIEKLLDGQQSLTDIALDYCFSSHSHYTNSFRKTFGFPPKQLRKTDWKSLLQRSL